MQSCIVQRRAASGDAPQRSITRALGIRLLAGTGFTMSLFIGALLSGITGALILTFVWRRILKAEAVEVG